MGLFAIQVKIEGETAMHQALVGVDLALSDFSAVFELIAKDFHEKMKTTFDNEGKIGKEDRWQKLSDRYAKYKEKQVASGRFRSMNILEATGGLKDSLTSNTTGSVEEISKDKMTIGTSVEYGIYHQSNKPRKRLPRRPFLTSSTVKGWDRIIRDTLIINLRKAQPKPTSREI